MKTCITFVILSLSLFPRTNAIDETCSADGTCDIIEKPEEVPKGANVDGKPRDAVAECVDRYPKECQDYASWGECEKNPGNIGGLIRLCLFCQIYVSTSSI